MSNNTVFLTRAEVGLVHWDEFRKPPYSAQDYADAYNNGINLTTAIMQAHSDGASKVVLERGQYPVCYTSASGGNTNRVYLNNITGTNGLSVDGNGSCIFTIFDSENKNPYHTNPSIQAYELPGSQFAFSHNTNLRFYNFELRGDQYNRSWVAGEENTEQTYGISLLDNNINTYIDVIAHGFRGDSITGVTKGKEVLLIMYDNWEKGGLSLTDGAEIVEKGAYKTPLVDLSGFTIYRNAVQLQAFTFTKVIEFRDDRFRVFFYDENNLFIASETAAQTEFIYLPSNCKFLRIVAYGDERTTDTVSYGNSARLVSGSSEFATIKGEFYANHRGGISNLCGHTTVDAHIHDIGTATKNGFPHYASSTRYAINFEDTYSNKLTVKGLIKDCYQGILCNGRALDIDSAEIINIEVTGIAAYRTTAISVNNCVLDNVKQSAFETLAPITPNKRGVVHKLSNNVFKNTHLHNDFSSENYAGVLQFNNNVFVNTRVNISGNGKNLIFDNNTIINPTANFLHSFGVTGALRVSGNTVSSSRDLDNTSWQAYALNAAHSFGNKLTTDYLASKITQNRGSLYTTDPIYLNGLTINNKENIEIPNIARTSENQDAFIIDIEDCNFVGNLLTIGSIVSRDRITDNDIRIKSCKFKISNKGLVSASCFRLALRESSTGSNHRIVIKDTSFDLTNCSSIIDIMYPIVGTLDIVFLNCEFLSDSNKTIPFLTKPYGGNFSNITARAVSCKFINVTNGK